MSNQTTDLAGATDETRAGEFVWNIPVKEFPTRRNVMWGDVARMDIAQSPLRILEIGVFRAGMLRHLVKRNDISIASYTGIDPYLGETSDPYLGSYWSTTGESNAVYEQSKHIFDESGHQLVRTYSHKYWEETQNQTWDLILVDGDHRYASALWDMHHWFQRLRPGGVMIADDYANSDTPGVTRAVNRFIELNAEGIAQTGYTVLPFQNKKKYIPISLTFVYWMRGENTNAVSWGWDDKCP